jgi:hypothetical protein
MSIIDAKPLMRTTGYPEPKSRYARDTSSTGTVFTGIRVTTRYLLSDLIISLRDDSLSGEEGTGLQSQKKSRLKNFQTQKFRAQKIPVAKISERKKCKNFGLSFFKKKMLFLWMDDNF